ncbi:hypothetical protein PM082_007093 [Marasmius tenuissimus]|nr:hypothetical protein PM082_007093 [Marasmius tenuissimus]
MVVDRDIHFDPICLATQPFDTDPGMGVALFVFGELSVQIIICVLTLAKTMKEGWAWSSAPTLSSVLNRDALYVSIAVSGIVASVIVGTYKSGTSVLFIFPIMITVVSRAVHIAPFFGLGVEPTNFDSFSRAVVS